MLNWHPDASEVHDVPGSAKDAFFEHKVKSLALRGSEELLADQRSSDTTDHNGNSCVTSQQDHPARPIKFGKECGLKT